MRCEDPERVSLPEIGEASKLRRSHSRTWITGDFSGEIYMIRHQDHHHELWGLANDDEY